jgi:hypothetical protein
MADIERYGLIWSESQDELAMEFRMITKGGKWKASHGGYVGNGLYFHFTRAIEILWPTFNFNRWSELIIKNYLSHRSIAILGPASSGKTCVIAVCLLMDYYTFPECTTTIICSTTKQRLEDRIWGEIKKFHRLAQENRPWIPGNLIEGLQRLVTDERSKAKEGRDFRNGIVGVAVLRGGTWEGLGNFSGLKNKRVRLAGDEVSLLPRVFVDAISNLDKNPDFKAVAMGNPKDTTDALGVMAEPSAERGGWEGGIDQVPVTKTWKTRRPNGVAIQLVGTDSPNYNGELPVPIISKQNIDADIAFYGKDSLWFSMMNQGMMPRGQGSRRVLTRQMCEKFGAFKSPVWLGSRRVKIACLDAAYRGVGGDRCMFGTMEFGAEGQNIEDVAESLAGAIINQDQRERELKHILALTSSEVVPINTGLPEIPEDQIVAFVKRRCESAGIGPENFYFDSGMRASLVSAFSRLWSPSVNGMDFMGSPSETMVSADIQKKCKDYYSKFITEVWYMVRLIVEASQFRGMTEEACLEFSAREWTIVKGNKIEVEPKDKMKLKLGRSPDIADMVAIGCWGATRRGFVIKRIVARNAAGRKDDRWKREFREKASAGWRAHELNPAA